MNKVCKTCHDEKPVSEFHRNGPGQWHPACKVCRNAAIKKDRKTDPEKYREQERKKYAKNPDSKKASIRRYYEKNREQKLEYERRRYFGDLERRKSLSAEYRKANRTKIYEWNGTRRARLRSAVPDWADRKAIRGVYAKARFLTACTGEPHHVDHIIPLQGERVSGLHVETNLRVITQKENLRKGRQYG